MYNLKANVAREFISVTLRLVERNGVFAKNAELDIFILRQKEHIVAK